jgi:hypothetical protein
LKKRSSGYSRCKEPDYILNEKMWSGLLIFIPTPFAVIVSGCRLLGDCSPVRDFPEEASLIAVENGEE